MHHKNIKTIIRKQLKTEYPYWRKLTKKEKKTIAKKVLYEVTASYDFKEEVKTAHHELIGLEEQLPGANIMNLEAMARFIEGHRKSQIFRFTPQRSHPAIRDEELRFIDGILDNTIINRLLSYDGYTPAMREFFPSNFLRAELLKAIRFPEVSYRKFCGDDKRYKGYKKNNDFTGMGQKQSRAFIGLPLNANIMLNHTQLSQFRGKLTFSQLVNLIVYVLHHFKGHGYLGDGDIHCVDSTEIAIDCQELLAKLDINGKKIRIYDDLDCDCGARRKKRDKSVYVVGYRMHTLTAINAGTGQSYPLISLLAPANHHDSHFLSPLIRLGKAIGLDLRFVTADEAYHDKEGQIYNESGVHLIKPPSAKVLPPDHVDTDSLLVYCDGQCEIPMEHVCVEGAHHEYKCSAQFGECPHAGVCTKYREIPIDTGYFQRILYGSREVKKALDIRKNGERPFNLLKHREGLEKIRVRNQHGIIARSMFSTMATLLLEMAGTRKKVTKRVPIQLKFPEAA